MEALWPVLCQRADSFITVTSSGLKICESLCPAALLARQKLLTSYAVTVQASTSR